MCDHAHALRPCWPITPVLNDTHFCRCLPRRLFDLTIFGQLETEVLAIRLAVLCPFVFRGFIGVSNVQWSGRKETALPVDLAAQVTQWCPSYQLVWARRLSSNATQRDNFGGQQWAAVKRAFHEGGGRPSDLAVVSEHDEIPMPHLLSLALSAQVWAPSIFNTQYFYYYRGGCKSRMVWVAGLLLQGSTLLASHSISTLRQNSIHRPKSYTQLLDQSWHLSTFMGPRAVVNKVMHAQHQECNRKPFNKVRPQMGHLQDSHDQIAASK